VHSCELTYVCKVARDVLELLDEFETAIEQHGGGTHRDPRGVLRDLREAVDDLYSAARDARDEAERIARGL
jgi:hypothetical protein